MYEVGAEYREQVHSVRVRVSCDDDANEDAAIAVHKLLEDAFECTRAEVYGRRSGGRAYYFEVAVPRN